MRYDIEQAPEFQKWVAKLKDIRAKAKVLARLRLIQTKGHFGDYKSVGGGVSELRIAYGKGYRVYYTLRGERLIVLLIGGNKDTQERDIDKAKQLLANLGESYD